MFEVSCNAKEYNAMRIKCDILLTEGEMESIALEDKNGRVIREWTAPLTSFEEDLDKEDLKKVIAVTQQGSKGSEGWVTITVYGKPKFSTILKRKIRNVKYFFDFRKGES